MKPKYDVFISYRRKGGLAYARCICYYLRSKGVRCFFDLKEINGGKFDDAIYDALDRSKYFLLLLTEGSLDRCGEADDWVRLEIEYAAKHLEIVPVIVGGNEFKFPKGLPELFQEIETIQQATVDKEQHFERDIDDLLLKRMPCIGKKISRKFERQAKEREHEVERAFCDRARRYKDEERIRIDIGGGHDKLMQYAEDLGLDKQRASILIEDVNNSVNRDRKRAAWIKSHPVLIFLARLLVFLAILSGVYCFLPSEMREQIHKQYISPIADACEHVWDNVCQFTLPSHK